VAIVSHAAYGLATAGPVADVEQIHTVRSIPMTNLLNSHWERVRSSLTPSTLRVGLAVLSLVALVLGGSAGDHWT